MDLQLSRRTERLTNSLIRDILQVTQRPGMISFAGGLPANDLMPTLDFNGLAGDCRQYGPSEGEPVLRNLIAQRLSGWGLDCIADRVLVTSGSQQGIDLVAKLFIDEGSPVIVETPTYLAAIQVFSLYGAELQGLPLPADGIDPEALRQTIARRRPAFVYLIPTFQNPSGYCYTDAARRATANVLDEVGVPLVEDDPYRDLAYGAADRTPICSYLERAPWVYLGSFSKVTAPGLRVGFLASSPSLFPCLVRLKQSSDLHTNRLGQMWLARLLDSVGFNDHLVRMIRGYTERRDAMQLALLAHFQGLAEWQVPAGGLFFWLRLIHECDTLALLQSALECNLAFMPGDPFFSREELRYPSLRLNFSHADPATIQRGIAVLAEILRETRHGNRRSRPCRNRPRH